MKWSDPQFLQRNFHQKLSFFFFRTSNISPWKGEEWWRNGRILKLLSFSMGKIIRKCRIFMDFPLPPRESAHDWNSVPKARSPKSGSHYAQSRIFGKPSQVHPKTMLKPAEADKPTKIANICCKHDYTIWLFNIANWKITMLLISVNHLFRLGPSIPWRTVK